MKKKTVVPVWINDKSYQIFRMINQRLTKEEKRRHWDNYAKISGSRMQYLSDGGDNPHR